MARRSQAPPRPKGALPTIAEIRADFRAFRFRIAIKKVRILQVHGNPKEQADVQRFLDKVVE